MNKNTVQRIFQLKGWHVRKRAVGHRPRIQALPSVAKRPNERWSTDLCRVWGGRDGWLSLALVLAAHKLFLRITFSRDDRYNRNDGYSLSELADMFLVGPASAQAAEGFCRNLANAINSGAVYAFDYPLLLQKLALVQPYVFLNVFLGGIEESSHRLHGVFDGHERHENPLNQISDSDIIAWCEISPSARYPAIASFISGYSFSEDQKPLEWRPIVYSIFEKAPALDEILDDLEYSIMPTSWSGSRAEVMQKRLPLFENLFDHENSQISSWARGCYDRLSQAVRSQREVEENRNRDRNESFGVILKV